MRTDQFLSESPEQPMPIQVIATLQGHPWDLWGLAKIFDGSDLSTTLVKAEEPKGKPRFDASNIEAINRFRIMGYDVFANLTSAELTWPDDKGPGDLRDMRPVALDVVARINGIALLLDPEYLAVKVISISYSHKGGTGASVLGDWTPNKEVTSLGRHPAQMAFAQDVLPLARNDNAVKFVLDAIALPRSWASLYLIYEAIAEDVGGVHELRKAGWVSTNHLTDFTNSANNNRSISEGARHGNKPQPGRPLIPLIHAYEIVNRLALGWLDWVRRNRPTTD
jgi:hypothetical protein